MNHAFPALNLHCKSIFFHMIYCQATNNLLPIGKQLYDLKSLLKAKTVFFQDWHRPSFLSITPPLHHTPSPIIIKYSTHSLNNFP